VRDNSKLLALLVVPLGMVAAFAFAETHPGYFTGDFYLGGFLGLQVLIFILWHYETVFFPSMMLAFLWAGTNVPLSGIGTMGRWVLLIIGALVGVVKWVRFGHRRPMNAMHMLGLLCILAALVSAEGSSRSTTSLLKTLSLALLFLYGAAGARVAVVDREKGFFRGLVRACEIATWITAAAYFGLGYDLFGNTNSLGAVFAVLVVPVLLWAVFNASDHRVRHRLLLALALAFGLLLFSVARAAIVAGFLASALMCLCMRRGKLMLQGAFVAVLMVTTLAVLQPERFPGLMDSAASDVVYKGHRDEGLLGSRKSPWDDTQKVIRESPWFGSGFGTDVMESTTTSADPWFRSSSDTTREHGSSYLTLLQYVGLLGSVPFAAIFLLILFHLRRVCQRMWRTGDASDWAIPLAFICLAGLIDAAFEDWLVAAGYYLNVFFWTSAFLLSDYQRPAPQPARVPALPQPSFVPVAR